MSISTLSPREAQIIKMLWNDHTQKEIYRTLGISRWTVQTYIYRARKKLGADTITGALAKAHDLGIVG